MHNLKRIIIFITALFFVCAPFVHAEVTFRSDRSVSSILEEHPTLSPQIVEEQLASAQTLMDQGNFLAAKEQYKQLLEKPLTAEDQQNVRKQLDRVNMKILFSPTQTDNSLMYVVESGDSLDKIAKKYKTTVALIKRSNHLTKDMIKPGMKLKVVKSQFKIAVDKSENTLKLYQGDEWLKTYRVATGEKNSTPVGTFTIETKLVNPVWYKTGAVIAPGDPENILGTRWMGFSLSSYGIHGTTLPETIGKQASAGCIRMRNADVEELFDIVPRKTEVTVTN